MIEIKHKDTGHTLLSIDADTLLGADLNEMDLSYAALQDADLRDAGLHPRDLFSDDGPGRLGR